MKLIIANWKMNPRTVKEAVALAKKADFRGAVLAPPFPFISAVLGSVKKAGVGAQDAFFEEAGPYTGEVSAAQLKSLGVRYVIIGHSERRALGDTEEMVSQKFSAAVRAGIRPILCVGERERKLGVASSELGVEKVFVKQQLEPVLQKTLNSQLSTLNFVIAYEPVWAISTTSGGRSDTPEDAAEMISFIKSVLAERGLNPLVLYGGSVNGENARGFLERDEVDGALVGGASLKPEEFKRIIRCIT